MYAEATTPAESCPGSRGTIPRSPDRSRIRLADLALGSGPGHDLALSIENLDDHVGTRPAGDEGRRDPGGTCCYVIPVAVEIELGLVPHEASEVPRCLHDEVRYGAESNRRSCIAVLRARPIADARDSRAAPG
jgi:hypothetical protein